MNLTILLSAMKENSEIKPVKLCLKINLVLNPAHMEGFYIYIYIYIYIYTPAHWPSG